jgi:hypothetical protein
MHARACEASIVGAMPRPPRSCARPAPYVPQFPPDGRRSPEYASGRWCYRHLQRGNSPTSSATRHWDCIDRSSPARGPRPGLPRSHIAINPHRPQSLSSPGLSRVLLLQRLLLARRTVTEFASLTVVETYCIIIYTMGLYGGRCV